MFSLIKTDEQDVYASHIFAINISQDSKIKVIALNQNYDKLISVNFYENIIKNGEEIKDRRLYILNRDSEKWVTKNNTKGVDFLINSCEKDIFDLIENDNFNNHEILQKCKKIHEKFIVPNVINVKSISDVSNLLSCAFNFDDSVIFDIKNEDEKLIFSIYSSWGFSINLICDNNAEYNFSIDDKDSLKNGANIILENDYIYFVNSTSVKNVEEIEDLKFIKTKSLSYEFFVNID